MRSRRRRLKRQDEGEKARARFLALHQAEVARRDRLARDRGYRKLVSQQRTNLREAADVPKAVRKLGRALKGHHLLPAVLGRIAKAEEAVRRELGEKPPAPVKVLEIAIHLGLGVDGLRAPTVLGALEQLARTAGGRDPMKAYFDTLLPVRRSDYGAEVLRSVTERTARIAAESGRERGARTKAIREEATARPPLDEDGVRQIVKRERRFRRRSK